jgi:hypothetical protein
VFDFAGGAMGMSSGDSKASLLGELLAAAVPVAAPLLRVKNPIKAYHGSRYDFDAFDASKIGTGEGAQAYGHGLYFAENPGVAKDFQRRLGRFEVDDGPIDWSNPRHVALMQLDSSGGDINDAANKLYRDAHHRVSESHPSVAMKASQLLTEILNGPTANRDAALASLGKLQKGHMYEVNIHANPDDFLDWNARLSQQGEKVQKALGFVPRNVADDGVGLIQLIEKARQTNTPLSELPEYKKWETSLKSPHVPDMTGEAAYFASRFKKKSDSSQYLLDRGIPGIKYLDQGSRAAGEGTRNYVVFDDRLIEIVKKYGIAGAVSAGLLSEAQARQLAAQGGAPTGTR